MQMKRCYTSEHVDLLSRSSQANCFTITQGNFYTETGLNGQTALTLLKLFLAAGIQTRDDLIYAKEHSSTEPKATSQHCESHLNKHSGWHFLFKRSKFRDIQKLYPRNENTAFMTRKIWR